MTLAELNRLPADEAAAALERCCGSRAWIARMLASRPFADEAALFAAAEKHWSALPESDWREAFAHHPRIGDVAKLRERFATTAAWASDEQRGAATATDETLEKLAQGNEAYAVRFGYTFIVCASGKSADEMLALLITRLKHHPIEEVRVAADEQLQITRLRLRKLLGGPA